MPIASDLFGRPAAAYRAVTVLCAFGLLISTLEFLSRWRLFRGDRIYSWRILGSRLVLLRHPLLDRLAGGLLDFPGVVVLYGLQAAALVALLFWSGTPAVFRPAAVLLALTLSALHFRNGFGDDGSDQMNSVLVLALLFHALWPGDEPIAKMGLWFVGLQLCLAYLASGLSKAVSPVWRSGESVFRIMNTVSYGSRPLAALLRDRPWARRALSWSVILMETLFPLCLFLKPPYLFLFLAWGLSFHLYCALAMGLNSFFWAFVATYPALLYCNAALRR